jgi:hypothetical protein
LHYAIGGALLQLPSCQPLPAWGTIKWATRRLLQLVEVEDCAATTGCRRLRRGPNVAARWSATGGRGRSRSDRGWASGPDRRPRAFGSKFREITRAITPGQSGVFTVTGGRSTAGDAVRWKDKTAGQRGSDLRLWWWPEAGSNCRPSDLQAEIARRERSSWAESVLRQKDSVLCRSAIRELVLANPLANYSPAALRPSHRISVHCRCGLLHYSCRCRRRASSTSAMTCAGTRPKTGPMRSTVTERTCSA